ncbi:unnamed protein product [Caretta caretta]
MTEEIISSRLFKYSTQSCTCSMLRTPIKSPFWPKSLEDGFRFNSSYLSSVICGEDLQGDCFHKVKLLSICSVTEGAGTQLKAPVWLWVPHLEILCHV